MKNALLIAAQWLFSRFFPPDLFIKNDAQREWLGQKLIISLCAHLFILLWHRSSELFSQHVKANCWNKSMGCRLQYSSILRLKIGIVLDMRIVDKCEAK